MSNNQNQNLSEKIQKNIKWEEIQIELKEKFGREIYESWLKKIEFVDEFQNYILISVSTRFIRDWITSRYLDEILKIVKGYKKEVVRIEFSIANKTNDFKISEINNFDTKKSNIKGQNISFIEESYLNYSRLDPNKNFENFVVGESNKLAYEASKKVSNDLAQYNPLYIYSGVGMGKTHLINAIGLKLKKTKKVMFISAERFMYQFVKSIKSNEMVKFKDFFRNTDVLIIDDVQFMNGKEALQEEFFHTFTSLKESMSQIIITADRPPNKLVRIQERIKSRFSGGLVVDIQNADNNLRYEIINAKCEKLKYLNSSYLEVPKEIKLFISREIKSNIREIVGALNRIISFSRIYNKVPNLSETRLILKDLLQLPENNITIELIQTEVCKYFKISKNEMLSSRRSRYLVRPRQAAIYLTKVLTSKSLPEIGRSFSNRDHTTVIHSVKTIEKIRKNDEEFNSNLESLKNKIIFNKNNEI